MEKIKDDVFILRDIITKDKQLYLTNWYLLNKGKFKKPKTKFGTMSLSMLCLGWHWNAYDYSYYKTKTDVDNSPVEEIPNEFNELGISAMNILKSSGLKDDINDNFNWDIAITNYYEPGKSKLGLHVDNSETPEMLKSGYPVISLSIGSSCDFLIGGTIRSLPIKKCKLNSGDILIFGWSNRLIYHGVEHVYNDCPEGLKLNGRLNITLRRL